MRIDLFLGQTASPSRLEPRAIDEVARGADAGALQARAGPRSGLRGDVGENLPYAELDLVHRLRIDELPSAVDRCVPQIVHPGIIRMEDARRRHRPRQPGSQRGFGNRLLGCRQLALRTQRHRGEILMQPGRRIGIRREDVVCSRSAVLQIGDPVIHGVIGQ